MHMADADIPTAKKLPFGDFIVKANNDIASGANVVDVIAEALSYPPVESYFAARTDELGMLWASGEEQQRQQLLKLFSDKDVFIAQKQSDLPQFRNVEATIMSSVPTGHVTEIHKEGIKGQVEYHREKTKIAADRARRIGEQFNKTMRERSFNPTDKEPTDVLTETPIYKETVALVQRELENRAAKAFPQDPHGAKVMVEQHPEVANEVFASMAPAYTVVASTGTRVSYIPPKEIETFIQQPVVNGHINHEVIKEAKTTVRFLETLSAPKQDFSQMHIADSVGGAPGVVLRVATVIPGVEDAFVRRVFENTLKKTLGAEDFVGKITEKLGSGVTGTDIFRKLIDASQKAGAPSGKGLVDGIGNILGDTVRSVKGPADERMVEYLAFLYKKAAAGQEVHPSASQFHAAHTYAHNPGMYFMEVVGSPGSWIAKIRDIGGVVRPAETALTSLAAQSGFAAAKSAAFSKASAFLLRVFPKMSAAILGALTPIAGWAALAISFGWKYIKKVLSAVGSFLFTGGGLTTSVTNGISQGILGVFNAPPVKEKNNGLILALVAGPILLLMLISGGATSVKYANIPTGREGIGAGGPTIDCAATPDIPECVLTQCQGDCQWPLDPSSGACILEGPFVGTHSECHISGIDFITPGNQGKLFGAPVYTPYSGIVSAAVFGYNDNSGYEGNQDGGTYGNHVKIVTDVGGTLLFAHLRNIIPPGIVEGAKVSARTVVGFVDHTGYSLDVHLHYEVWSPGCPRSGDINKFTPFPVPPCENVADCAAKIGATGYSSCL